MLCSATEFHWKLQIGDPTLIGWVITFMYLLSSLFSFRAACLFKINDGRKRIYLTWTLIGLFLLFLSFNKQLDFQTLIIDIARSVMAFLGVREYRISLKWVFVGSFVLLFLGLSYVFFHYFKDFAKKFPLVTVGFTALFIFILLRLSSFHLFNKSLNHDLQRIDFFVSFEFLVLLVIFYSGYSGWSLAKNMKRDTQNLD